jgi:hypothetical protein
MHVVLTGPATTRDGKAVLRGDLAALARTQGHTIQTVVNARTEILVASRADTVKARAARNTGIKVVDYPTFIASLGGYVPAQGALFDKFVDGPEAPAPKPTITGGMTAEQAAQYAGWL